MKQGELLPGMTGRRQRPNGSANKLAPEDLPAHDWYRFVLSFPPHLVREYLQRFQVNAGSLVLDPFCGTGTTLVECKKLGIPSVGVEAHPMAHFAAATKTDWTPDPGFLAAHASEVARVAFDILARDGIRDMPSVGGNGRFRNRLKDLPDDSKRLLLANSISPLPLHKTLVLIEALSADTQRQLLAHERLALARALVSTIGNLHFGPEVGLGEVKPDAPVLAPWLQEISKIVTDLKSLRALAHVPAKAVLGDARTVSNSLESRSVDAVFTSPPYPNEKDYTRTTRLETVLLGFISNKSELRALKHNLIRSNTRGVYKGDEDHEWISQFPEISALADQIEKRRQALGKTSGFERMYPRVTLLYFGGMARHLADLRRVLRPGALLGYVVGDQASYLQVMIRTGELLSHIAVSLGFELVGIDLFRTRLATATRQQLREEVVVLRWPG